MDKMYIDYEWGVEVPIMKQDGTYLRKIDLNNFDLKLKKMILLWSFSIQNQFNWHNPNDTKLYLPDYYFDFINKLEKDIIINLKQYNISLIKNVS